LPPHHPAYNDIMLSPAEQDEYVCAVLRFVEISNGVIPCYIIWRYACLPYEWYIRQAG